ncbi:hypothetical protein E2562_034014 [Oryza meyeriana var. granulata]|uniref:Uncharacterized protein n=1 Tax=Oryza meyeriana var. granulata TaxID=110450 RepID=A0A6G1E602_9ORYZ|nr:hypothetical protein E2562_034014 [Oryza meyeriana var. granulata]
MEKGKEIFASIDSLWFYSSVFLPLSAKQQINPPLGPGDLQPGERDSTEIRKADGGCGHQDPGGVGEAAPVAGTGRRRAAAAARSREVEERRDVWQEQCRQMLVVVAAPARCSPLPMPHPSDGPAMRAHLRSWAHAVACSVR